ncbi:NADP-dependent oxidoreductase domain-containing protein [Scleroderma yunnanense]
MKAGTIALSDGHELPTMAFGTGSTMKFTNVTEYVKQAIDCGFCHIDTASIYQTEKYIGIVIRESGLPRSSLYITTKYSGGVVREHAQESLEQLGLSYVDLYLVHKPSTMGDFESSWREFEGLKKDELVKSIGVSNFTIEDLKTLLRTAKEKPVVNQIKLHPYNYAAMQELLSYCAQHRVVIEAYGCLTSLTKNPGGPVDAVVDAVAKRRGATASQILFAWVKSKGAAIVTTSRSEERLREYLATENLLPLTPEEIVSIDEAGAKGPL